MIRVAKSAPTISKISIAIVPVKIAKFGRMFGWGVDALFLKMLALQR